MKISISDLAEIIETRVNEQAGKRFEYYVHYDGCEYFPRQTINFKLYFLRIYTITHADIPEILTLVCPFIFSLDILLYYRS